MNVQNVRNGNELVSIIVPVYNSQLYLEKCIDSLICQTYTNIEIIIIDDGSTDNSVYICKKARKKDSRIKIIRKENQGPGKARNVGIDVSAGEYITFIDSDDIVDKCYIERLIETLTRTQADISMCMVKRFKLDDNIIFDICKGNDKELNVRKALEYMMYQRIRIGGVLAKLIKKSILGDLRMPECIWVGEDVEFIYQLFMRCAKIILLNDKLYGYRVNQNSITHQPFNNRNLAIIEVSRKMVYEVGCKYPDLQKAAANRAFVMNRVEYSKLTKKDGEYRDVFWEELLKYRKIVLFDSAARTRDRVFSMISYLGKDALSACTFFINILMEIREWYRCRS